METHPCTTALRIISTQRYRFLLVAGDEDLTGPRPTRVLVVEDDPDLLSTICEVLAECGFDGTAASSAADAIAELERHLPPSCVLLDLRLPHRSGDELLLRLRHDERWQGIPVAVMTAYPLEALQSARLADALLPKPFTLEALEGVVTDLCSSARHPPGAAADDWCPPAST